MNKTSTQKLLIQYIYGEMPDAQNLFIEELMQDSSGLKEQHDLLLSAQRKLPKFTLYPRKSTIQNILEYSRPAVCV